MTLSISNLTVQSNAPAGTAVGVLTAWDQSGTAIPCNFILTKNSAGDFGISGNNLVTEWSGSATPGNYSVRIHANGINTRYSSNAVFTIVVSSEPAPAIDSVITLASAADAASRRQSLTQNAWNAPNLPTAQSTVTSNITNPFPSFTNIARVDQYAASMTNGQSNTSNLYIAGPTSKNRLVILNPGHQDTCDWTAFASGYRIQPVLQALLNAGFDVFAMNMPNCGSTTAHAALFNSYGDLAMQYFIEPIVQALNYMDANASYLNYNMTGLSGGGWTTAVAAALDTRIEISVAVAGSMPGVQFIVGAGSSPNHGDCASPCFAEQNNLNFYQIAGFLDLYIMAACGTNRQHVQILNNDDDCCYGNSQWTDSSFNFQNYYDVSWLTYLNNYSAAIANAATTITPMNYSLMVDNVATQHQISTWAQSEILTILG